MQIERGFRGKLFELFDTSIPINVTLSVKGPATYDFCCFGVDENNLLKDDAYMIFYKQLSSPERAVEMKLSANKADISIHLERLPRFIKKLVFTISIDGDGAMHEISKSDVMISQSQKGNLQLNLNGNHFSAEKAIIAIEIYHTDTWRIGAVARGFNGGLNKLLKQYGGTESTDEMQTTPTQNAIVSKNVILEKQLKEKAPHLTDLAKKLTVRLEKESLDRLTAKVAIVLDASGSMSYQYKKGKVQKVLERLLLLAMHLDDDGACELWAFAKNFKQYDAVTINNYNGYIDNLQQPADQKSFFSLSFMHIIPSLGVENNEPPVMDDIISYFEDTKLPVYVLFISDGGIYLNHEIAEKICKASAKPIFWQFLGLGGSDYGVLKKLDTLSDRIVDNAGFFAVEDIDKMSDDELYKKMLEEFPLWLKAAKEKNLF